jgi:DNA-binding transcriptional LysR family regulator
VRRPPFTLEQIRSFVEVAGTEHISRAAAALYLSQAAVTQQIRHFERAVGLQLLERDGRRVRLTDAGRALAESCRGALRAVQVMDDTAKAIKELEAGSLHVGASPTCATYYLPPRLAEFTGRHPSIKLDVVVASTDELNHRVLAGSLDCAVIEGEAEPGLVTAELSADELILVAHPEHALSHLGRVTPTELARYRYLRRGPEFSAERLVRKIIGDAYDRFEMMDLGHHEYVRAATIAGLGFAALPRRAVVADLRGGLLKALPWPPMVRSILAVRRTSRGAPAQEVFWALLTGGAAPDSARISSDGRNRSRT